MLEFDPDGICFDLGGEDADRLVGWQGQGAAIAEVEARAMQWAFDRTILGFEPPFGQGCFIVGADIAGGIDLMIGAEERNSLAIQHNTKHAIDRQITEACSADEGCHLFLH